MSITKIMRKTSGPIVVVGKVDLTDEAGNSIEHNPRFSLCGCGKSENMPFCDGAHKEA
jgi:CDGSH-type Zn-finger protein